MDESKKQGISKEYTATGFLAVSGSHIGWGISDVCIKIIGRGQVATWVHGVTGAIFLIFVMFVLRTPLKLKDFLKSFPIGAQRALSWAAIFIAFQEDNPAIAITVLSFSLVVSIIVFGPMLGEKLNAQILLLSFVGVIGLLMTSLTDLNSFELSKGALISLIALPIASAGTYILRNVQKQVPTNTVACYMYIWIAILLTPVMFFVNPKFGFTNHEIFIIIVLTVFGAGGHIFFNYSQKRTSFRFNAIASTVHTPSTAIFTWWFLGGTLEYHQILGMVIVTGVVAYMSIVTRSKKVQELEESLEQQI